MPPRSVITWSLLRGPGLCCLHDACSIAARADLRDPAPGTANGQAASDEAP